jgi:putative redox protein
MNMKVEFRGGTRFDIVSGRHTIVTDQPVEDGGQDAGMSPVELFVGSLASCVAYFVGRYCTRHKIACAGFTVDAEWSYAEQPHRVGAVSLRIDLPAQLTPEQRERLLKVAHGCTVHQSLAVPPALTIDLHERAGAHGISKS